MTCRLAIAFGVPPSEIDSMATDDYFRMVNYYNSEPFGFPREEARMGELIASVHRASPNKWRDNKVFSAKHWMFTPKVKRDYQAIEAEWSSAAGMRTKRRGD